MIKKSSNWLLGAAIIFLLAFILFLYLEFNPNNPYFSGYDSYYHIGLSEYIKDHGLPSKFPYLYFTILRDNFVDHHMLFHIILLPFILIFGNVVGPKIFIAASVGLIFMLAYLILRYFFSRLAFPAALVLLFLEPSDFYFRQAFIRNPAPSLLFLVLAFYLMLSKRYKILFLVSFLYGWLYIGGGSLFLFAMAFCYIVACIFLRKKIDWKLALSPIAALLLSLIVNPYFPGNLYFSLVQVWKTGLQAKEYTGGEWRPYDTWFWFGISYIPLAVWGAGISLAISRRIKLTRINLTAFFYAIFLLLLEWKSKRFVEYWPFWATLSGLMLMGKEAERMLLEFWENLKSRNIKSHAVSIILALILAISILFLAGNYAYTQWKTAWRDTTSDFNVESAREAHKYLMDHSNEGDIVFTDDWDVFPVYFYLNRKNYYIVGLDPEFMNQYDHNLYMEFADISSGRDPENLERIRDTFKAKWVLVNIDHWDFRNNLKARSDLFKEVYTNEDYFLFKVK